MAENAESRLLSSAGSGETNRQNHIQNWLYYRGVVNVEASYPTSEGPADLYLPNRRCIIEVKRATRLGGGPHKRGTGSKTSESAYEQLERYILAERKRERLYLDDEDKQGLPWLGIVTDSSRWWAWEWPPVGQGNYVQKNNTWNGTLLKKQNVDLLAKLFDREVGKEWAPINPAPLFGDAYESLKELYEKEKDVPATITQYGLWLQQLEAGGNAPTHDIAEMFVRHTLLILITRLITRTITQENDITAGFVQWVPKDSGFLRTLGGIIDSYNWRQQSTDILRSLYDGFIPHKQRKLFGEYYTPDWLAERICNEVIDEKYIEDQIVNFRGRKTVMGVLDPCCGSGTFLVHAINRIRRSKIMQNSALSKSEYADFMAQMIHGIDIHPVAIEIARVNILRLIPTINPTSIQIYQGDSMMITKSENTVLSNGGENILLESPRGTKLVIPKNFLRSNDDIRALVESAKSQTNLPPGLGVRLNNVETEWLNEAHSTLTKIIREEQNGVWYWFIINQAAPILLCEKKVGRIVSNPPWVSLQEIRNESRRDAIIRIAKEQKLYVGKETAGRFDIAMLAVSRCMELYLEGNRSGWVLPQGAMLGAGNWDKLGSKLSGKITDLWDWGRLPFPNTPTCTILVGKRNTPQCITYRKRVGRPRIMPVARWDLVMSQLEKRTRRVFPDAKSEYVGTHGASLQPKCLVRVATETREDDKIRFTTEATFKEPWKKLGSRNGLVPSKFVRDTLISSGMFPFYAVYGRNIIPILDNGEWDADRTQNEYWNTAQSLYKRNMGKGKNTPKTLECRLDYNGGLTKQLESQPEYRVAYNSVGDYLYAAVIPGATICGVGMVSVYAGGHEEARFLSALLNARCLHDAFVSAQKTDRNFHLHILNRRPLPHFVAKNETHKEIVRMAIKCEALAKKTYRNNRDLGEFAMRAKMRHVLHESGLQRQLYDCIRAILPDYVVWDEI